MPSPQPFTIPLTRHPLFRSAEAPEAQYTANFMTTMDGFLQNANQINTTVFVASGDNESSDGMSDGLAHADFPASSPNVVGCGGSVLTISGSVYGSEEVWNNGPSRISGGGVSDVFDIPAYQTGSSVPPSANPGGRVGRGVPDVAGHADSYTMTLGGAATGYAGTSAVAPSWAGLMALINNVKGTNTGFFNPILYSRLAPAAALHGITTGTNGAYNAGPGWNACCGWGRPIGTQIENSLNPPTVTGINPNSGPAARGTSVTIAGSGLTGATAVGFGATGASTVSVDSDTQITAVSPPGSGTVDVTVTTPAGTSATSAADQFTYTPEVLLP